MIKSTKNPEAHNYCVAFIDLLGQREALRDQGLLKRINSEQQRQQFDAVLQKSVLAINKLQKCAESMLAPTREPNLNSRYRAALPPEHHAEWDEMQRTRIATQRWSDGLVSFLSLGDTEVKCRMNGVFHIFALAGILCLLGLAEAYPVRGAIEVAWGVELYPGELYGAAVARAYEIESEIAQYPRIVVGPGTIQLLEANAANLAKDTYSRQNRDLASLCHRMLFQDADGHWVLHYLGEEFRSAFTKHHHIQLYDAARKFIFEQLHEHKTTQNTKLAFRYSQLLQYFNAHQPTAPQ